jgi:hypothetical protein
MPSLRLRSFSSTIVLVLGATLLGTPVLVGQELPWLPKGRVRLDFAPDFWTWETRYGLTDDGTNLEESLGTDLTASPLGSAVLPDLRVVESALSPILEDPSYRVRLGNSQAAIDQAPLVFPFRLELGVTDRLTVGAMVPIMRQRQEILFLLDADATSANVGLSPMVSSTSAVSNFLNSFGNALNLAGETHAGDPAVVAAQAYLDALSQAYFERTVFPISGSAAAAKLQEELDGHRAAIEALGVTGIPEAVVLAQEFFDETSFQAFLGGPEMNAAPLESFTTLWQLGDIEVSAAFRVLSAGFEPDSLGDLPPFRYHLGAGALVRLGTGSQEDPNRFFDLDAGDGQLDVEGSLMGRVEYGTRLRAWGRIRYGIQMEGEVLRRIAAPSEVLPRWQRLAPLLWTPGNYLDLELNPGFALAPDLNLGLRYHLWSKGADSYKLQPLSEEQLERVEYPPADLLDQETEQTLQEVGFSAAYSTLSAHARGDASLPYELRAAFLFPVSGSGGQTPKGVRFQAGLTIYKWLWGNPSRDEEGSGDPVG